ncbi:hypothetical protein ACJX0J_041498, partial [Zea mays]
MGAERREGERSREEARAGAARSAERNPSQRAQPQWKGATRAGAEEQAGHAREMRAREFAGEADARKVDDEGHGRAQPAELRLRAEGQDAALEEALARGVRHQGGPIGRGGELREEGSG